MRKTISLILLAGALVLLLPTGGAQAGSYYVFQCPQSTGQTGGSAVESSAGPGNIKTVGASGSCLSNRWIGADRNGTTTPALDSFRGWKWTFPTGIKLTEVTGGLATCRQAGTGNVSVLPQMIDSAGTVFARSATNINGRQLTYSTNTSGSCGNYSNFVKNFLWTSSGTSSFDATGYGSTPANLPAGGSSSLELRLLCGDNSCTTATGQYAVAESLRMKFEDTSAPTIPNLWGPWTSWMSTPNRVTTDIDNPVVPGSKLVAISEGSFSLYANAVDQGGGISSAAIAGNSILGIVALEECDPPRNWGDLVRYPWTLLPTGIQPCPLSVILDRSTNTAGSVWKEGLNFVSASASDFANNSDGSTTSSAVNQSQTAQNAFIIDTKGPLPVSNLCYEILVGNETSSRRNGWWFKKDKATCVNSAIDLNTDLGISNATMVAGLAGDDAVSFGIGQGTNRSYESMVLRNGPRAYWKMDESRPTYDAISGNSLQHSIYPDANIGRSNPVFAANANSPVGKGAWDFSSATHALSGTVPTWSGSESVSAWIKPGTTINPQYPRTIIENSECSSGVLCFPIRYSLEYYPNNGSLRFSGTNFTGNTWSCTTDSGAVKTGRWAHVVASRQAQESNYFVNNSGLVRIYVNGNLLKGCSNTLGPTSVATDGTTFIGSGSVGFNSTFPGLISHVSVFNGPLRESEVPNLYFYGCRNMSDSNSCYSANGIGYKPLQGVTSVQIRGKDALGNIGTLSPFDEVKVDYTEPIVSEPDCAGTAGNAGWYTSSVNCLVRGTDNISKPKTLEFLRSTDGVFANSSPISFVVNDSRLLERKNLALNPGATAGIQGWTAAGASGQSSIIPIPRSAIPSTIPEANTLDSEAQGFFAVTSTNPSQYISTSVNVERGKRYVCSMYIVPLNVAQGWTVSWRNSSGTVVLASKTFNSLEPGFRKVEADYVVPENAAASSTVRCGISRSDGITIPAGLGNMQIEQIDRGSSLPFFDRTAPGSVLESPNEILSVAKMPGSLAQETFSFASQGTNVVSAMVTDNAGLSATGPSTTVRIDLTDPASNWTGRTGCSGTGAGANGALVNDWYTSNVSCTVAVTDSHSGPESFSVNESGGEWGQEITVSGSSSSSKSGSFQVSAEKANSIRVRARDVAGRTNTRGPFQIKIDKTSPSLDVSCSSPNGLDGWYTSNPSCTAAVSDATSLPSFLAWAIDVANRGGEYMTVNLSGSGATRTGSFAVNAEGAAVPVTFVSRDGAGNQTDSSVNVFKIDKSDPLLTFGGCGLPDGENGWFISPASCPATVSDGQSRPQKIDFSSNGGTDWSAVNVTADIGSTSAGRAAFSLTGEGSFNMRARTSNASGRNSTAGGFDVRIDRTNPQLSLPALPCGAPNGGDGWYRGNVNCSASIFDATSKPASFAFRDTEGGTWSAGTLGGSSNQSSRPASFGITGEGVLTVTGKAKDFSGRESAAESFQIKVDQTPPVDGSSFPASPVREVQVASHIQASDALSGFDPAASRCWLEIEGTLSQNSTSCQGLVIEQEEVTGLRYVLYDRAGNQSAGNTVSLLVDRSVPGLDVDPIPEDWQNPPVTVTGQATKASGGAETADLAGVGVSSLEYLGNDLQVIEGGSFDPLLGSSESCSQPVCPFAFTFTTPGITRAEITASDQAGNQTSSSPFMVKIDSKPPVVELAGIAGEDAGSLRGPVRVFARAVDPSEDGEAVSGISETSHFEVRRVCQPGVLSADCGWQEIRTPSFYSLPDGDRCGDLLSVDSQTGTFSCWFDSRYLYDTAYELKVVAEDYAGNSVVFPINRGEGEDVWQPDNGCPIPGL